MHFLAHIHAKDTYPTLICHCVYDDIPQVPLVSTHFIFSCQLPNELRFPWTNFFYLLDYVTSWSEKWGLKKKKKVHGDCHFKSICHIDSIFHVHILEVYVHVSARYKVSMSNAVTGIAVHRWWHQRWRQQHTMDKSWLHRLIGMYAKWANKNAFQSKSYNKLDVTLQLPPSYLYTIHFTIYRQ